jgi:hypothetical protein
MNLSIEDLEAIKAIVREVVKEELARVIHEAQAQQAADYAAMQQHEHQPVSVAQPAPAPTANQNNNV